MSPVLLLAQAFAVIILIVAVSTFVYDRWIFPGEREEQK